MKETDLPMSYPEGTIPVKTAIQLTANSRTYLGDSNDDFNTCAFLIPIISFKNILLYNPDAESVRAYIGLTDPTDPKSGKLVLVPGVNGKDVPYVNPPTGTGSDDGSQSNTYDITKPCPPECDTDSPLNMG